MKLMVHQIGSVSEFSLPLSFHLLINIYSLSDSLCLDDLQPGTPQYHGLWSLPLGWCQRKMAATWIRLMELIVIRDGGEAPLTVFHFYMNSLVERPLIFSFSRSPCPTLHRWCPIIWASAPERLWNQADNGVCHLKGHSILTVSCLITKPPQNLFTPLSWPPSPLIETCFCKSHSGLKSPHQRNWSENFYIRVKCCCRLYFPSSLPPPTTMFFSKINLVSAQLHRL